MRSPKPEILAALALATAAHAQPTAPGYDITEYTSTPATYQPYTGAWGPGGYLYLGSNDNSAGGVVLRRVPPGGGATETYAAAPIYDPDGVAWDATGAISGVPGALLVAAVAGTNQGALRGVHPATRAVFNITTNLPLLNNLDTLAFDSQLRLYGSANGNGTIVRFVGSTPSLFAPQIGALRIASLTVDGSDRPWAAYEDNRIRRYTPGAQLNLTVEGLSYLTGLTYGDSLLGPAIYAVDAVSGRLVLISDTGAISDIGTGFQGCRALSIGPDRALYIASMPAGIIWRISGCPADFDGDGFLTGLDFDLYVTAFEAGEAIADFDSDGFITGLDFDAFVIAFEAGC